MPEVPISELPVSKKSCKKVEAVRARIEKRLAEDFNKGKQSEYWHKEKHSFRPSPSLDKSREDMERAQRAVDMRKKDRRMRANVQRRAVVQEKQKTIDGVDHYDD